MRAIRRQKGFSRLLGENQRIRFDDAGVETTRTGPEPPVKADVSRFAKDSGGNTLQNVFLTKRPRE
jgi:hypothetical protein